MLSTMRTTVTLDPDTEQVVRQRMASRGVSFKVALNDAIREGASNRVDVVFSTQPVSLGQPRVDLTKALQIAGDLEDAEILSKIGR